MKYIHHLSDFLMIDINRCAFFYWSKVFESFNLELLTIAQPTKCI